MPRNRRVIQYEKRGAKVRLLKYYELGGLGWALISARSRFLSHKRFSHQFYIIPESDPNNTIQFNVFKVASSLDFI
jgi:hypothetical protein